MATIIIRLFKVICFAFNNNMHMLCTSSYAAHKLQYSDRTSTKPFKAAYAEYLQMKQELQIIVKKKF